MKIRVLAVMAWIWVVSLGALSRSCADVVEFLSGHGDIGLAFEDSELELHYHFGDGAVLDGVPLSGEIEYDPSAAYVRIGDNARFTTTASLSFLGTSSGDFVWRLPQGNQAGLPFLGIAAEELGPEFSAARLQLTSFSGPGEFSLWQPDGLGGNDVYWQTNDGLDENDLLNVAIGGHDHFFYGFTAEGIYDLELTATADFASGGSVSDVGVFRFAVGSATAIPEPGSVAMLGCLMIAAGWRYRRHRRPRSPVSVA